MNDFKDYIASQTLALQIEWGTPENAISIDFDDDVIVEIGVTKV